MDGDEEQMRKVLDYISKHMACGKGPDFTVTLRIHARPDGQCWPVGNILVSSVPLKTWVPRNYSVADTIVIEAADDVVTFCPCVPESEDDTSCASFMLADDPNNEDAFAPIGDIDWVRTIEFHRLRFVSYSGPVIQMHGLNTLIDSCSFESPITNYAAVVLQSGGYSLSGRKHLETHTSVVSSSFLGGGIHLHRLSLWSSHSLRVHLSVFRNSSYPQIGTEFTNAAKSNITAEELGRFRLSPEFGDQLEVFVADSSFSGALASAIANVDGSLDILELVRLSNGSN
jgi:hypothetical protein